jgi:hypothetical protein
MPVTNRLFIAVSAALLIASCSREAAAPAAQAPDSGAPASQAPAADVPPEAASPAVDAAPAELAMTPAALPEFIVRQIAVADLPPQVIGGAGVTLSLANGVLWFSAGGSGYNPPSGDVLAATPTAPPIIRTDGGDIDLSGFPPGDVQITVSIDDSVVNGGYSFPADPWQAVTLAVAPAGQPAAAPVFGQSSWPANFLAPSVADDQRSVTWIDTESDQNVYEYSLALDGPSGRLVIDPKIKPGGSTTR